MRRKILFLSALLIFIILFSGCTGSATTESLITVGGTGTINQEPDSLKIRVVISTEGKTAEVQAENAEKVQEIITSLSELGLTEKEMQTENLEFYPKKSWQNGKEKLEGYRAAHHLLIDTMQIELAGKIGDMAIQKGAEQVSGLTFYVSEQKKAESQSEAIAKAVEDARNQAEAAAAASGMRIEKIKELSVYKYEQGNIPVIYGRGMTDQAKEMATPVIPGDVELTYSVNISYIVVK